jgi:Ala-tRNA(Pro) deacylase
MRRFLLLNRVQNWTGTFRAHTPRITVPADIRVDLKRLPATIGCKRVSFGKAEEMVRLLGIEPGSVTPLAAIHDGNGEVIIVLDSSLLEAARINVHPLRNTATMGLAPNDLLTLLKHWQHPAKCVTIPSVA